MACRLLYAGRIEEIFFKWGPLNRDHHQARFSHG